MKTAEEIREKWLNEFGLSVSRDKEIGRKIYESAIGAMIEFAKLHVEAALEDAADKAEASHTNEWSNEYEAKVDTETIINAYPLEKIK